MDPFDAEHLRALTPQVLGALLRRGFDFTTAEDAVADALLEAVRHWPDDPPRDPKAWLITVAGRKALDAVRSESARARREERVYAEPDPGPTEAADDTLLLLSRCCHSSLTAASAIALTLRAVGGLSTAQIASAFLVPEPTMAQRITRAKRSVAGQRFDAPGDVRAVLRVLYLIFDAGFTGDVDLAAEAIRLTRQLRAAPEVRDDPEVDGLLALMLLHHARRAARRSEDGALVPLAHQDRSLWDTAMIADGVDLLQGALARDRLGEYQAQAAIAALHDDAASAEETDWPQILEWYDELVRIADSPVVRLNRAVAVGEVDGPLLALRSLEELDPDLPRWHAVAGHLRERAGDVAGAAASYRRAAERADNVAERDHLVRQAARVRAD
ncbi:RNA polymerase subunit sigma-24 [Nocardioides sp. BGMRC 2183]|nr:RNA polymerase subunit sigma-24 [Nocardioides sp. BGMRC 2183]